MTKWKIQQEEFDDKTPNGRKRWNLTDAHIEKIAKSRRTPNEKVVSEFREVWGDRFDYSKVNNINHKTRISIICREHGEFLQFRLSHLRGRQGCKHCASIERKQRYLALSPSEKLRLNANKIAANKNRKLGQTETFLRRFREIWGDRYDYSLLPAKLVRNEEITVSCREHGSFVTTPLKHSGGSRGNGIPRGCKICRDGYKTGPTKELYSKKYDISKISKLVAKRLTIKQVANEMKLSEPTIRSILKVCFPH